MKSNTIAVVEVLQGLLERALAISKNFTAGGQEFSQDDVTRILREDASLAGKHNDALERRKTQLREENFREEHGRAPRPGELEGGQKTIPSDLPGGGLGGGSPARKTSVQGSHDWPEQGRGSTGGEGARSTGQEPNKK